MPKLPAGWLLPKSHLSGLAPAAEEPSEWRIADDVKRDGATMVTARSQLIYPVSRLDSVQSETASKLFMLEGVGTGGGPVQMGAFPAAPFPAAPVLPPAMPFHREPAKAAPGGSSWTGDAWVFLRPEAMNRADASGALVTYGASQAGAVLRYRLSRQSRFAPTAFIRASSSLAGTRQAELALGVSARPVQRLPVTIHAEVRASEIAGETELRPSIFAVAAPPAVELPARMQGRFYAQAGYVGGSFATAFVDGQAKIDREIIRLGPEASQASSGQPPRLRAGVGAWGGAQSGAARADIGPTVSAQFDIGRLPVTAAADYRFRISGEAQPASGAALTLSTNF
ncbi:hypothetical protein G7A66_04075 [Altererythrobacter sp. SALINAS58]|uniref:hypothetical protein n=1 Tax=Alteripontixanthobacter muriae TaxID=2705546 RepID=UPI001575E3C2|nr:hypothetical protein [Alteripontixanthobacter muriae]NTZ42285.1 hypothetical protein [Alteripontixanthobacter muriae]